MALVGMACSGQGDDQGPPTTDDQTGPTPTATASPACDQAERPPVTRLDVTVDGLDRTALVHLPPDAAGAPLPVVLSFHALTASATVQQLSDGLSAKADSEGFVVVHPEGSVVDVPEISETVTDVIGWDVAGHQVDERGFVRALLGELGRRVCIDPSRVYATGLSNGGDMALALGCGRPGLVAAVAPVSAGNLDVPCPSDVPTPTMAFHGTDDEVVLYDGAPQIGALPVEELVAAVADRNGCTGGPDAQDVTPTVRVLRWPDCDVPTVLYRLRGHGHSWPGHPLPFARDQVLSTLTGDGGPPNPVMLLRQLTPDEMADTLLLTNVDVDATDLMWELFAMT